MQIRQDMAMRGEGETDERRVLRGLYSGMLRIRRAEEALGKLFADNLVPGFIHLSVGQEGVAVGVTSALLKGDTLASNHRGHGHALAMGMAPDRLFLEVMGREGGICKGRGGSMHVADFSAGMLGANGIVGAGAPIALGSALAHQVLERRNISVSIFGDGALAEGSVYETLNLASLWRLPLLLVCENNGWSEFSRTENQFRGTLAGLAQTFGIPCDQVDGRDVLAVHQSAKRAAAIPRGGGGPAMLECITHRFRGHYEGDAQRYRDAAERESALLIDPLAHGRQRMIELGEPTARLAELDENISAEIAEAVAIATKGANPDFAIALADVYAAAGQADV
jgi:pyruvate dehydrogenase E1 component alpha subunit